MKSKNGHLACWTVRVLTPIVVVGAVDAANGGETCVTNANGPDICVAFEEGTPQEGENFTVDYSDPSNPSVILISESLTWNVRSDDNGSPGNIGSIRLNPIVGNENYGVSLFGEGGTGAGAIDVVNVNLTALSWSGSSSITGGWIGGDLTGVLTLVEDSGGNGGDISGTFTIGGDVSGDITVPEISGTLDINGDLSGDIDVTVKMDGGWLDVAGAVSSAAVITIADMDDTSGVPRVGLGGELATVAGDLVLQNGVRGFVDISGEFTSLGSIDLNGKDVLGRIRLWRGGAGSITNGGNVSYQVWLTVFPAVTYSGTATFSSVSGFVQAGSLGSLDGTINVTENLSGTIVVENDLLSNGLISVGGIVSGEIRVGDMLGDIEVGGDLTGTGEITVFGNQSGDITILGDAGGDLTVTGSLFGTGTIGVAGDVSGDIVVQGHAGGNILAGALTSPGATAVGRILIGGLLTGDVTVAEETQDLTLIRATEGIGYTGMITINDGRGNFNANGTIHIGSTSVFPMADVTFDGTILIKDDINGDGGDLNGTIKVVGCHLNTPDLDICICGGDGNENVQIVQPNCDIQVDWSCVSGCP